MTLAWGAAPRAARAADQTLELEVVVNGVSTQKIGEFTLRDGVLYARPDELGELGLKPPRDAARTSDGLVAVSALPGVAMALDPASQILRLTAADAALSPTLLGQGPQASAVPLQSNLGATLNYDVAGQIEGAHQSLSGLLDGRVFSPLGVASTDLLVRAGQPLDGRAEPAAVRLDSTYVYSDYARQRRYRLGDVVTGGLTWTRPVRLGGFQVSQDFSMRPDLVTFPLPAVSGSAAVPSTVDLLVNGTRALSGPVPSGPFQAPQLPVVTGAGQVTMTVTDALGRQVVTTLPFYASASLLAPGLHTASVEAGFVRRNWGVLSNDYGGFAASGTWRAGLSSHLTVETHAEGASGQVMAGAGIVANAFDLAVVDFAAAASHAQGRTGASVSAGIERQAQRLSFAVHAVVSERDFRDLAARNGDVALIRMVSASVGLNLGHWGSLGAAYAETRQGASFAPPGPPFPAGPAVTVGNARVLSGNYSVQLGRASLYATAFKDFAAHGQTGASVGVTVPFGRRSSVTASANAGQASHAQVQVQQSVATIGDWGYQAFVGAGGAAHAFAQVQYKAPFALISAGADHLNGQTTGRIEAQGAVSLIDHGVFASNTVNDSFAVIDTSGQKGVKVYYENREIGRTDRAGRLLAPDLLSFQPNRLSIDPSDLPADVAIETTAREVRPPDRSGVVVVFPIKAIHAALLTLVDEQGAPIPLGATARLRSGGEAQPVGYDGQAFFDQLGARNQVEVELPKGGRCVAAFAFTPVKGDIPSIGPLTCRRDDR